MPRCLPTAILCWAMATSCPGDELTDAALAEETGQIDGLEEGQGIVIELDESVPGAAGPAADESGGGFRRRELADSDVELIIGGQGTDGIAKRSRLKKED